MNPGKVSPLITEACKALSPPGIGASTGVKLKRISAGLDEGYMARAHVDRSSLKSEARSCLRYCIHSKDPLTTLGTHTLLSENLSTYVLRELLREVCSGQACSHLENTECTKEQNPPE